MGLIRTMGGFCYVECDTRNCTKKMEHVDEKLLRELAGLCAWENRGKMNTRRAPSGKTYTHGHLMKTVNREASRRLEEAVY